jgi:exosortase/archaeosortase family protein
MKKQTILSLVILAIVAGIIMVRMALPEPNFIDTAIQRIFAGYTDLCRFFGNLILRVAGSATTLVGNTVVYESTNDFAASNPELVSNWPSFVMFKKWVAGLLVLIWVFPTAPISRLKYTALFGVMHILAVMSALVILTLIGPIVYKSGSESQLYVNIIGELLLIAFLFIWLRAQLDKIHELLSRTRFNFYFSLQKLNIVFFMALGYSLLKNFFIPFFDFKSYVFYLLSLTKFAAGMAGFESEIDGPYLTGTNGTLFMAKWCLGLLTMYLFASVVFLSGKHSKAKWIYIVSGLLFLHIVNILRLAFLFVYVQTNEDLSQAMDHHDIFNIIFYTLIFILWIIWFELFVIKKQKH